MRGGEGKQMSSVSPGALEAEVRSSTPVCVLRPKKLHFVSIPEDAPLGDDDDNDEYDEITLHDEYLRRHHHLQELQGSQPLPVINVTDDVDGSMASHEGGGRPRAGTWSISQSRQSQPQSHLHVGHGGSAGNNSASSQHESSSSKQPRRRSGDDINLVQGSAPTSANASQAASPSRKPALFDSFRPRSKSDATRTKKSGTIISHMKSAMQHSLMSSPASSRNQSPNELSSSHSPSSELAANQSSVPGRPRAGSESSGKGPVSKVMDMFRYRSHSAVSAEDKRKAV